MMKLRVWRMVTTTEETSVSEVRMPRSHWVEIDPQTSTLETPKLLVVFQLFTRHRKCSDKCRGNDARVACMAAFINVDSKDTADRKLAIGKEQYARDPSKRSRPVPCCCKDGNNTWTFRPKLTSHHKTNLRQHFVRKSNFPPLIIFRMISITIYLYQQPRTRPHVDIPTLSFDRFNAQPPYKRPITKSPPRLYLKARLCKYSSGICL
mmetsp:Transcript_11663/g.24153  ORF Transcript_11663/g.24153 Transcript_11663/m.24153 type:complete len:207 (-) Transcript_11663:131-751(-)